MDIKTRIINRWMAVNRPGIEQLVDFLEESDFFTAPCSTQYHLAEEGGLAQHSWSVYNLLDDKVNFYSLDIPDDSIAICGLGHDLCKVYFYGTDFRNVKENGTWIRKEIYVVNDQFPLGHGEKSVSILQDFIKLTDEEKLAIRWHMCAFDPSIHFNYPNGYAYSGALKKSPLVTVLFTADFEASNILEANS